MLDAYDSYRRMFASTDTSEIVVWWYCGVVIGPREGVGEVPLTQAETIMAYRTRDLGPDRFAIDWTEVGCFRDITTGEILDGFFNPFLDRTEPYPKSFVDGPATFTISRSEGGGAHIHLVQHNARIDGVSLAVSRNAGSVGLVQTETKTRTYHRPDGSLPALDSPEATAIETVLSIWSPNAALADTRLGNVPSRGFYRSGSRGASGGAWAATTVRGTMQKARDDERLNPIAWARLQRMFPAFFKGDRVAPVFG